MHKNKNYITNKISKNWNNLVLPTEETILTRTPEEACYKKIINPLLNSYRKSIELNISLYKKNKGVSTLLRKRLTCIENMVKLKKILANNPHINEQNKNNPFLSIEKNTLTQLTKELIQHNQHIQSNKVRLSAHQISEDHIQPLIFNILAEAFNHLAALDWNRMVLNPSALNSEEFYPTCSSVLNAYETRLRYLKEEKKCLSNSKMRLFCDKKISSTLKEIRQTIDESFNSYNILLSTHYLSKKEKN